jgi:transcription elongation GreA/GreB family factor
MDDATKQRIKAALVTQANDALAALRTQVGDDKAATEIPEDDTFQADDLSQADEAGDLGALFEQSVARQQAQLETLQALDFSPTDTVRPGAVVAFGGSSYVVGVVADEFDVDGVTYEGISADAPVGEAITGLKSGDSFTFNGRTQTLDAVG